jgi:uncharacterized protein YndB with AHSA1/START domain
MDGNVVSVTRVIPAPPADIFALVADPSRHPDIDGSGSVRQAQGTPPSRLALGDTFGMGMHLGIGYSMVNTVIEFEPDRRIAWQARPKGAAGRIIGGRIWRYELEPVEGGTEVTESWDISQDHQRFVLRLGPVPRQAEESMTKTLARIEELTAGP